jgi:L-glyceraldehyde 3-phosphate reductase
LNEIAKNRNQSLAQMAISWILKDDRITSVLIGASKTEQIIDSVKAIENTVFSEEELANINAILK